MAFRARRRSVEKDRNQEYLKILLYADVAKLADAQVSGSCGQPYGFKSLHPHQQSAVSRDTALLINKKVYKDNTKEKREGEYL